MKQYCQITEYFEKKTYETLNFEFEKISSQNKNMLNLQIDFDFQTLVSTARDKKVF